MLKNLRTTALQAMLIAALGALAGAQQGKFCSKLEEQTLKASEHLGPITLHYGDKRSTILASIREFLWTHWSAHRPGIALYRGANTEGEPSCLLYSVEQNNNQEWIVRMESDSLLSDRRPKPKWRREHSRLEAYSVQRVVPSPLLPDESKASQDPLRGVDLRPATDYRLRFLDKHEVFLRDF